MRLPDGPYVRLADNARILVVKRNNALKALELDEETTDRVQPELSVIEWTTALSQFNASRRSAFWTTEDGRAFLCIRRHSAQAYEIIRTSFFPEVTTRQKL